jgi:hypothetical protein
MSLFHAKFTHIHLPDTKDQVYLRVEIIDGISPSQGKILALLAKENITCHRSLLLFTIQRSVSSLQRTRKKFFLWQGVIELFSVWQPVQASLA